MNLNYSTRIVTAAHVDTADARVTVLTRIGSADGHAADVSAFVLASVAPTFDWTARGAVGSAIVSWLACEGDAPAQTEDRDGKRVRTTFGRGVDAVAAHMRRALGGPVQGCDPAPVDGDDENDGDDETPENDETPDYLALAVQAAFTAVAHGVDGHDLMAAIEAVMVETLALDAA